MILQRLVNAPVDIEIYDTNVTPEVPYNLTGLKVKFTVKRVGDVAENDDDALINKIITTHTDAVNGLTSFTPSETERAIATGFYKADIKIFNDTDIELNSESFSLQVVDIVGKTKL